MQSTQRRIEARSNLETHLARVLMGELVGPRGLGVESTVDVETGREGGDYVSIEVVREAAAVSDSAKTIRFRRDATDDLVTTIKFVREAMDADDRGTLPFVRYSAPYELIDIQHVSKAFVKTTSDLPEARTSGRVAAVERVSESSAVVRRTGASSDIADAVRASGSFEAAWFAEPDDAIARIEDSPPTISARPVLVISLLVGALAFGVGIGFLAV